ncbi:site-2 protease family protein [Patescibacteria group bacterium]|nr:site-2 protease family protein [Patescibacteria group bacterium]MBU1673632.1 site-2 protease family protein [Patescibacteria group bacterium]MBU1963880.1 site-2 protease family protein [Patescibacteria group bacterium]
MLISLLFEDPTIFFIWILAVIFGITIHEFSHVLSAYWQGDNTGQAMGRLTLNPLKHLDPIGTVMIMFIGFGWGKPAPYNPYNLKYKKWGPALVSIAGPASNVISLLVFGIILKLIITYSSLPADNLLIIFLFSLIQMNLILALFNLLPIPPLDGSKVLFTLIPVKHSNAIMFMERYGMWMLLVVLIFGSSYLFAFYSVIYNWIIDVLVL